MSDPLNATVTMHGAARKPENDPGLKLKRLYNLSLKTFPRRKELKDEKKCTLRNSVFNHAESLRDQEDRDNASGSYSSTKKLLIEHMKFVEEPNYRKAQRAMNVWVGWLGLA